MNVTAVCAIWFLTAFFASDLVERFHFHPVMAIALMGSVGLLAAFLYVRIRDRVPTP
jgi:hypothetical protein